MRARDIVNVQDQALAQEWFDWHKKSVKGFRDFIEQWDLESAAIKVITEFIKAARNADPQLDPRSQRFRLLIQEPLYYQLTRLAKTRPRQQEFWPKPSDYIDQELDFDLEPEPKPKPEESVADLLRQKVEQEKQAARKAQPEKEWQQIQARAQEDAEKPDEFDQELAIQILADIKLELGDRYESVVAKIQQELNHASVLPDAMTSRAAADHILVASEDPTWFPAVFGRQVDPRLALIAVKRAPDIIHEINQDLRTPTLWLAAARAQPDNMFFVAGIRPDSLRQEIIKTLGLEEKWQKHLNWLERKSRHLR